MKVVIPVAGVGSRLKPHTHTLPKCLMEVAGKPIIDYVINDVLKLNPSEIIFVVGYKRSLIKKYVTNHHPDLKASFITQKVRDGYGSAVRIALENITEEEDVYIIFGADTLIDFDITKMKEELNGADALVYTMEVFEPKNYGIVDIKENLDVIGVEEKPEEPKSNLAIIGAYYFKSLQTLKKILTEFYEKKETEKGEYKIVQAIRKYIEIRDLNVKASKVNKWFDCGRVSILLESNKYFLQKKSNGEPTLIGTNIIIPPAFVSKSAKIQNCVIGPYASIGEYSELKDCIVKDSIVSYKSHIENLVLKNSLIGKEVTIHGKPSKINIGEKSEMYLE